MSDAASRMPGWRIWLWRGIIALALILAFVAYQDPHLMLQLGNQLLSCF